MKLTKSDKEAFVRAVMDDVPKEDFQEQAHKLVTDYHFKKLPAKVRKVIAEIGADWVRTWYVSLPCGLGSTHCTTFDGQPHYDALEVPGVAELAEKEKAQSRTRRELKAKVEAMIAGCSTLKQAKERLPEFEKYLPQDRDGTGVGNLPAIANVVADLVTAGWPKDAKKEPA